MTHAAGPLTALALRLPRPARSFVAETGAYMLLLRDTVCALAVRPRRWREVVRQMHASGVQSLPITLLTAVFTGMVLALQTAYQLKKFGAEMYVGGIVGLSMARELGPVMTGLMVAGRVGAGIAASLGTMAVTEQIDALRTMGTDPVKYLVLPRTLALAVMLPVLTVFTMVVGCLGGYAISVHLLGINADLYYTATTKIVESTDILNGLLKSAVFGAIIALSGCYAGLNCRGGAEGVGKATTFAVVLACILILVANYFLTAVLYIM
ncbi:MAG TPA: ABC transporter permease [bacterium]|nr:ABC transporter permease [bacterium]